MAQQTTAARCHILSEANARRAHRHAPHGTLLALCVFGAMACMPERLERVERPEDLHALDSSARGEGEPEAAAVQSRGLPSGLPVLGAIATASKLAIEATMRQPGDESSGSGTRPAVVFAVTGNTRGELNLSRSSDRPSGGLARRASVLAELRTARPRPIILDLGDALSAVVAPKGNVGAAVATARAEALLKAYGAMRVDVMLVGLRDLRVGFDVLDGLLSRHKQHALSTNLVREGGAVPVVEPVVVLERSGTKVGIVGLTAPHRTDPRFFEREGRSLLDAEASTQPRIAELRAQKVDVVVLMSGLGMAGSSRLIEGWSDPETLPDLVLVGGTARLTREPEWARGVPLLEAGDRGRYVLVVRLYRGEDRKIEMRVSNSEEVQRIDELRETLGRIARLSDAMLRHRHDGLEAVSESYRDKLLQRLDQLRVLGHDSLSLAPPAPRAPGFDLQVIELGESIEPHAGVQKIVNAVEKEARPQVPSLSKGKRRSSGEPTDPDGEARTDEEQEGRR